MPQYRYEVTTAAGERVTGRLEAVTALTARQQLAGDGFTVVTLTEEKQQRWNWRNVSWSVSQRELTFFTKNFSVMLNAGLTVVEALIIAEGQARGRFQSALQQVLRSVESGNTLADSFAKSKRIFSTMYVDVIRTGELAGTLARNFQQLADQLEANYALRRKVQAALIYPAIVFAGIIALGTVLSIFVLPRLTRLFESLQVAIPLSTAILLQVADFLAAYWWWLLLALGIAIGLLRLALFVPTLQYSWHYLLLRLPLVGTMVQQVNLARFTTTLGSLLASGVPIAEALTSAMQASANRVYRERFLGALRHVEQGGNIAIFLEQYPRLFPPIMTRMVAVGEQTGRLEHILLYLGKYYDLEVDQTTRQLSVTLEPALLLVIGVIVGFIGISIITPIYQFTASVGRL